MNQSIFEDIRRNVDIVEVIGHYIPLSRLGKNYKGLCPFHNDAHPSLVVSPEKQIFTCFSCGATGNAFTFVRDYEKISFIEAVKKVCQITGVAFPKELEKKQETKTVNSIETRVLSLLKDLTNYYSYQLKVASGEVGNKYLAQRNLNSEEIERFQIGYAPNDGFSTIKFLTSKGYTLDEIVTSGVAVETSNQEYIDRLRGRVIFPLCDSYGRVVAYSGRRIDQTTGEKYVNTPETILFHKGNMLYNYHNANNFGKKETSTYVVEGFMDAISLYKSGINSVVATMGTAFTNDHIKLLESLKSEIRLLFDSDGPGLNATYKSLSILDNSRLKVMVVKPINDAKDIDELLQSKGAEAVRVKISDLWNSTEFRLFYIGRSVNFNNHEDAKKYVQKAVNFLALPKIDEFDREHYIKQVSDISGFSQELIRRDIKKLMKPKKDETEEFNYEYPNGVSRHRQTEHLNRYAQVDRQIIQMMIEEPLNIIKYKNLDISLCTPIGRNLAALIIQKFNERNQVSYADLFDEATPEVALELGQIIREIYPKEDLNRLAKIVQVDYIEDLEEKDVKKQILETNDAKKQADLAAKVIEQRKKKQKGSNGGSTNEQ